MSVPQPATPRSGRPTAVLWFLTAVLLAAVALMPAAVARLAAGPGGLTVADLPQEVSAGFDRWFAAGGAQPDPELAAAVRFWAVFHVVKAGCAVALLAVLILLLRRLWAAPLGAGHRGRRALHAAAAAGGAVLAAVVLLVVLANVQGAVAPLSSVLSFLPTAPPSSTMTAVRAQLRGGVSTPFLTALVGDFRSYHAAFVVVGSIAVLGLLVVVVVLWRRRAQTPRAHRSRRTVLAAGAASVGAMALLLAVIVLANATTVSATEPALAAFLGGGR
ncbi:hypothetical protein ACTHAM_000461 [Cellulomonas soli]|uniref:hypothetical protein n=1 Tax=Cellulomonas soli TaxID=931535 RepID=UPI003F8456A8